MIAHLVQSIPSWGLVAVLGVAILVLGKAADSLVDKAVDLAKLWGLPPLVIGATIVSLGTTLPELMVSALASIRGNPGIALGNSIGSVICDTALILGLASLVGKIPLPHRLVTVQGWIQLGSGILLALLLWIFSGPGSVFTEGSRFPQGAGFFFLLLLLGYVIFSIRSAGPAMALAGEGPQLPAGESLVGRSSKDLALMAGAMVLIILASDLLISTVTQLGVNAGIAESVIALSVVAFGTSLPELVTVVSAVHKGHGEIALGNVMGADILNILLVTGMAAAVTPGGLRVEARFFTGPIPVMLGVLILLRIGIWHSEKYLLKRYGALLLLAYILLSLTYGKEMLH